MNGFELRDVLAIASIHPYYSKNPYPPQSEDVPTLLAASRKSEIEPKISSFPLTRKEALYKQIARLTIDLDPRNGYRQGSSVSVTGGGSGGGPSMVFATDSQEIRQQRAAIGSLLQACGIVGPGDWVMTMHVSGYLYRALDLTAEILEASGATALCVGSFMGHEEMVEILITHRANTISGDAGQIIQLARYVSTLAADKKRQLQLLVTKALYTSEAMAPAQRAFLNSVFPGIAISSVIGSAEAGPWAVSPAELTESAGGENYVDFVYDQRPMHLEVFPFDIEGEGKGDDFQPLPDGEKGLLVQTSLQRLRHPLVRYVCGDVCSLHPLPEILKVKLPASDVIHYKIARIYGRDRRISFCWYGEYFDFPAVQAAMRLESWGILQYQIIRRYKSEGEKGGEDLQRKIDVVLELRVLRHDEPAAGMTSREELTREIRKLFHVFENNEELFDLKYLADYSGFARSATGRKVVSFIDQTDD